MDYHIRIEIDQNGNFTYTPSTLRVTAGDTIEWCSANPFLVSFRDETPLIQLDTPGTQAPDNQFSTGKMEVSAGVGPSRHHYAVGIYANGQVFMDADCPVIIVS
jgi:hypothetical protein